MPNQPAPHSKLQNKGKRESNRYTGNYTKLELTSLSWGYLHDGSITARILFGYTILTICALMSSSRQNSYLQHFYFILFFFLSFGNYLYVWKDNLDSWLCTLSRNWGSISKPYLHSLLRSSLPKLSIFSHFLRDLHQPLNPSKKWL